MRKKKHALCLSRLVIRRQKERERDERYGEGIGGSTTPMNLGEGDTVYSDLRPVVSITERIYEIIFGVGSTWPIDGC